MLALNQTIWHLPDCPVPPSRSAAPRPAPQRSHGWSCPGCTPDPPQAWGGCGPNDPANQTHSALSIAGTPLLMRSTKHTYHHLPPRTVPQPVTQRLGYDCALATAPATAPASCRRIKTTRSPRKDCHSLAACSVRSSSTPGRSVMMSGMALVSAASKALVVQRAMPQHVSVLERMR
jgi:hypothetical protein